MSISNRLLIGFGSVLAVVAAAILVTGQQMAETRRLAESVTGRLSPQVAAASALSMAVEKRTTTLRGYATTGEQVFIVRYRNAVSESQQALEDLRSVPATADAKRLMSGFEARIAQMHQEESRVLDLIDDEALRARRTSTAAFRRHQSHLRPLTDEIAGEIDRFTSEGHKRIKAAALEFDKASSNLNRVMIVSFALALLLALLFTALTVRSITGQAGAIASAADGVAEGDYTKPLSFRPEAGQPVSEPRDELLKIALAVGNMAHTINRREKRLAAHASLGEECTSTLDVECLLDSTLDHLARHTGAQVEVVYLPRNGKMEAHGVYGISREDADLATGGPGGLVDQAARSRRAIILPEIPGDTEFVVRPGLGKAIPKSIACMPMVVQERVVGVLVSASLTRFGEDELETMRTSADQIGIALSNAVSHQDIQRLAQELQSANEQLDAQNEELQAQNEELQAQNEEIQAQNEEIQTQNEELAAQRVELQESYRCQLTIAETLQKSFLPNLRKIIDGYEFADRYVPAQSEALIGGDFYDVIELSDGVLGVAIGDVSGKGVGATVHMAMAKYMLRAIAAEESDPAAVLALLNNAVTRTVRSEIFITMCYGVLYTREKRLVYANAGHELPLLLKSDTGLCMSLDSTGQPLGILPDAVYGRREVRLSEGDALVLFTDGITEARKDKQFFGQAGLQGSIAAVRDRQAGDIVDSILSSVEEFTTDGLKDDAAVMVIKSVGKKPENERPST